MYQCIFQNIRHPYFFKTADQFMSYL